MGKRKLERGAEPPRLEPTSSDRRAAVAARLMRQRVQEAERLAEDFQATRDPRELAS